ncbi:MAG: hypothetical protein ACREYE_10840 [Gammaproteobacteria bacterium]
MSTRHCLRACEKSTALETSRSVGAQEPECIVKYMRIPSTAGTRPPFARDGFFTNSQFTRIPLA